MTSVRVAVVRLADAADELRRVSCEAHDSAGLIAANRCTAIAADLLAEREPSEVRSGAHPR
jgi:hypothetical protein